MYCSETNISDIFSVPRAFLFFFQAMAMYGLLLIVPSFAVVGFAQSKTVLYLGITLYALSTSVVVPCLSTGMVTRMIAFWYRILFGCTRHYYPGLFGRRLGPRDPLRMLNFLFKLCEFLPSVVPTFLIF